MNNLKTYFKLNVNLGKSVGNDGVFLGLAGLHLEISTGFVLWNSFGAAMPALGLNHSVKVLTF